MQGHGSTIRRSQTHLDPRATLGFTLIEVLVVVVIIGIAGAVVVPQMLAGGTLQIQAAGRMVIADLILAQSESIAHQAPRRVMFDPLTNSYRVADAAGNTLPASWRMGGGAGGGYEVDFTRDSRFSGVRLTAVDFEGASEVAYDALGSPSAGGTIDLASGNVSYRIRVAAFTGQVTITRIGVGG